MTVLVSLSLLNIRALSSRMVDGMFLMRTSQHAGTQTVISVWNENECKHYKLFQDKVGGEKGVHASFLWEDQPTSIYHSLLQHSTFGCSLRHSVKPLSLHACFLRSRTGFP